MGFDEHFVQCHVAASASLPQTALQATLRTRRTLDGISPFNKKSVEKMQILDDVKTGLLCFRLDDQKQQVINKRLSEDIVLDPGEDNRIVGIEILDASKYLNLEGLLPVKYEISPETV
jgi:uncharacterized protein YuzE